MICCRFKCNEPNLEHGIHMLKGSLEADAPEAEPRELVNTVGDNLKSPWRPTATLKIVTVYYINK